MEKNIFVITVVVLGFLGGFLLSYRNWTSSLSDQSQLVEVVSSSDGRVYKVRDLGDKEEAARTLGVISNNMDSLISHLSVTYPDREETINLKKAWSPSRVSELAETSKDLTSYTLNKESLVVCIRDKKTNDIENIDTLMFVVIHEAAHMAVPIDPKTGERHEGHGKLFWETMRFLLRESIKIGIYTYKDYGDDPEHIVE